MNIIECLKKIKSLLDNKFINFKNERADKKACVALQIKHYNYPKSEDVNALFDKVFETPWTKIDFDDHYIRITMVNNLVLSFWSANVYHAWASKGWIQKQEGNFILAEKLYQWNESMPSPRYMLKMVNCINNYKSQNINDKLSQIFDGETNKLKIEEYIEDISI